MFKLNAKGAFFAVQKLAPLINRGFVEECAYVFIAGRRQAQLDKAAKEIGRNITGIKADISNLERAQPRSGRHADV